MADKAPPGPGFELAHDSRVLPDGSAPPIPLAVGKAHEVRLDIPGEEAQGATVPETAKATGGLSIATLGEKFSASASTGAGAVGVAIPLPPGRGISPTLGIGYSSNAGNGPFGWGWRSSLPFFTRSTTKAFVREHGRGLPEYDDGAESDVFIFSDAEDLVKFEQGVDAKTGEVVTTYRARVEGGFARIERREVGEVSYWVVRSADNIVSTFGKSDEAQVVDPADPKRVFSWLLQEQRDALGNVIVYRYKKEDTAGVDAGSGIERERLAEGLPPAQRYLKRILYGNRSVLDPAVLEPSSLDEASVREAFMFEVALDYGEHAPGAAATVDEAGPWFSRPDTFLSCRSTFDVRTRRLCRRVLVFHRFAALNGKAPDEPGAFDPVLVRAVEFGYEQDAVATRLVSVSQTGFDIAAGTQQATPAREFSYSPRTIAATSRTVAAADLHDLDFSADTVEAEFIDLDGVGVAGLLTRESGRFIYRAPGPEPGTYEPPEPIPFGASASQDHEPHKQRFLDLSAQGRPGLVEFGPNDATVWERDRMTGAWGGGQQIGQFPPVADDPVEAQHRVYLTDLDGDGLTDVLVATEGQYTWWRRMGEASKDGWVEQPPVAHNGDENAGPGPVLFEAARDLQPEDAVEANEQEVVTFADMTGDGLADVVRLRTDEVAYWPNLGYGKFGRKVTMDAPGMGEAVKTRRVRMLDIDGTGTTDILYLGAGGTKLWVNACGNALKPGPAMSVPDLDSLKFATLTRLDGKTTGSLAFAKAEAGADVTVIDLVPEPPLLLVGDRNNLGSETSITYTPSTTFYRRDLAQDQPWITRLPITVSVVERVESRDLVSGLRFTSSYSYHHGHYDPRDREFRGFGRVEHIDAERRDAVQGGSTFQTSAAEHLSPPNRTKTWFHTGAEVPGGSFTRLFADEYSAWDDKAASLPDATVLEPLASPEDRYEATRALRGRPLRVEVYGEDDDDSDEAVDRKARPVLATHTAYAIKLLAARGSEHHASVLVFQEQSLTYAYERKEEPDPRLSQSAVLEVDDFGNTIKSVTVAYPRRAAVPEPTPTPPVEPPPPPKAPPPADDPFAARLTGFVFDEARTFIRPEARNGIAALAQIYERHPDFSLLIVGHTDREGHAEDNLSLSQDRAHAVAAFLTDDVDFWLSQYETNGTLTGDRRQWGAEEDEHMLQAAGFELDEVGAFQAAVEGRYADSLGLTVSFVMDEPTRRALITEYMALDGTTLPAGTSISVVAAGEHFPVVASADGVEEPDNRRTEVFFFPGEVTPEPRFEAVWPDSPEYPQWRAAAERTIDISAEVREFDDPAPPAELPPLTPELVDTRLTRSEAPTDDPQLRTHIVASQVQVENQDTPEVYRVGTVFEYSSFEVLGKAGDPTAPFSVAQLRGAAEGGEEIAFEAEASGGHQRRLLARTRTLFYDDALGDEPAPLGQSGLRALPFGTLQMAMTEAQVDDVLAPIFEATGETPDAILGEQGRYTKAEGAWWVASGRVVFDPDEFYLPISAIDVFGHEAQRTEYDADHFLAVRSTEVVGEFDRGDDPDDPDNITRIKLDYRVLQPAVVVDANNTVSVHEYDALGRLSKQVTRGARLDVALDHEADDPFALGNEGDDRDNPTRLYTYDLFAFAKHGKPVSTTVAAQIEHGPTKLRIALSKSFVDGSGAVLQSKVRGSDGKFRSSGLTVVNNKGAPVLQYRAFRSSSSDFEPRASTLVATTRYDVLGRAVQTEYADGTLERVDFDAWHTESFDRNDTVLESAWLAAANEGTPASQAAAEATTTHANTPTHTRLDVLGRGFASVARFNDDDGQMQVIAARQHMDVLGNVIEVIDARGNVAEKRDVGMLGQVLRTRSFDGGTVVAVSDAAGKPLRAIDARGATLRWTYDELQRPLEDYVRASGSDRDVLSTKRIYGDKHNAKALLPDMQEVGARRRGRLFRVYDGGGEFTVVDYDLAGNPNLTMRRMTKAVLPSGEIGGDDGEAGVHDWSALAGLEDHAAIDGVKGAHLENRAFTTNAYYDAMGRAREVTTPASDASHLYEYSDDGLLGTVRRQAVGGKATKVYDVAEFDEFGRPLRVSQGGAATTRYTYDDATQRLMKLSATAASGKKLQDLRYTYDAIGNITEVANLAHKPVFFAGEQVEAVSRYRYDGLYRLVQASGREHESHAGGRSARQAAPQRVASPNDPGRMRNYTQHFVYDAVGNIQRLRHVAAAGSFSRWYEYSAYGNRLRATGKHDDLAERYEHDAEGNMTSMPHVDGMTWNALGQLQTVRRGTQTVHFQYAGGQRIRKLVEKGGGIVEERLYFGHDELFEKRKGVGFEKIVEQTSTEHVGGSLRVETKTIRKGKEVTKPKSLWRYQIADHLGSSTLEVDQHGKVISYEEFHPYGTTSYRATSKQVDVSPNRYRFTGMERDDETGLALHGARYYAPWLGRWTSADPIGLGGGINRYRYCDGDPVGLSDRNGMAPGDLVSEQVTIPYESPRGQPRDQHIRFSDSEAGESVTPFGRDADGDPIVSLATGLADHPDDAFAKAQARGAASRKTMNSGFLGRKVFGVGTLSKVLGVAAVIGALSAGASVVVAAEIGAAQTGTVVGTGVIAAGGGGVAGIANGVLDSATRQYVETGSVGDVGDLVSSGVKSGAIGAYSAFGLAVIGRGLARLGPDKRVSLPKAGAATTTRGSTLDAAAQANFLGGEAYGDRRLSTLRGFLARRGVNLQVGRDAAGVERAAFMVPEAGAPTLFLPANPTRYQATHELAHYVHYRSIGREAYRALPRTQAWNQPEQAVFDMMEHPLRWCRLSEAERRHAIWYIERVGGFR